MLTTTIAKKNLNCDAKKVVICQIMGKLKIPNSPSSNVKKPKKLIFIDERINTVNGKTNETNISILLTLLSSNF
jgi:hypothetical protein